MKKDELFELVSTLNLSEKGYFKKFSSGFAKGKHKNYLRLFDALCSLKEYDEVIFRKKFREEKFIKHLASEKTYLYNLLLRSLKLFHEASSSELIIQDGLAKVELLFDRGLYSQARKILLKVKEPARRHERSHLLLEIIDWEYLLPGHDIMKLAEERKTTVAAIDNHEKFKFFFKEIQLLYTRFEKARNPEQLKLFQDTIDAVRKLPVLSIAAQITQQFCETYFHSFALFDLRRARDITEKMILFMEEHPEVSLERYDVYIIALGHQADNLFQLKENDRAFFYLDKLKALDPIPVKYKGNIFNAYYNRVLSYYNYKGDFQESVKLLPLVEKGLERYKEQMGIFILRYHFIFFNTWFGVNDFKKANMYLQKMMDHPQTGELEERDSITRLLFLVNCYELNDIDQLEYRIVSTYRYLRKRNKLSKFEQLILKFVRSLTKVNTKKELKEFFSHSKRELKELFKDELEKRVNEQFDFIAWLDSKLENISYADAVKRAYENNA